MSPPLHGPHPHEHPRPRGPHAHERIVEFEGEMTHAEINQLLGRLGAQLAQTGCMELGEHKIPFPNPVKTIVLQERGPKGDLIVRLEFKWTDGSLGPLPIAALLPDADTGAPALAPSRA
jgi:hypothetical protein